MQTIVDDLNSPSVEKLTLSSSTEIVTTTAGDGNGSRYRTRIQFFKKKKERTRILHAQQ
jgi:hypothetical protein